MRGRYRRTYTQDILLPARILCLLRRSDRMKQIFGKIRSFPYLIGLASLAAASSADAQSWCRHASQSDEKLICRDARLGLLDDRLNTVFNRRYWELSGPAKNRLDNEELAWLLSRHKCRADYTCIEHSYLGRIEALSGAAAGTMPEQFVSPRTEEPRPRAPGERAAPALAGARSGWINPAPSEGR